MLGMTIGPGPRMDSPLAVAAPVAPAPVPISLPTPEALELPPAPSPVSAPSAPANQRARTKMRDPYEISDRFVEAIIAIESRGDTKAVGKAGERGLMQIMPDTWSEQCRRSFDRDLSFELAFVAEINRQVGTGYLEHLRTRILLHRSEWKSSFHELMFAGYNAGPTALRNCGFDVARLPAEVQGYTARGTSRLRAPD